MRRRRLRLVEAVLPVLAAVACGDGTTEPAAPPLEIVPVAGQGAFVVPGGALRLEGVVREVPGGAPRSGVEVRWAVERGDAVLAPGSEAGSISDAQGRVWTVVRPGSAPGPLEVRVTLAGGTGPGALFTATAGGRPRLDAVSPTLVAPGSTLVVEGAGFSPRSEDDVVLFSGIRGVVTASDPERLEVTVPPCLPGGTLQVTVQLGTLVSEALPVTVTPGARQGLGMAPGGWIDVEEPSAPGCLRLEGGAAYLVVGSTFSTVGGARHPVTFRGLAGESGDAASAGRRTSAPRLTAATRWEAALRRSEAELASGRVAEPVAVPRAPARVPTVGDRRTFRVLNVDRELEEVSAVVRHVGDRAVVYVDEAAPAGGFSEGDLAALAGRFDGTIHPVVTAAFGDESDLDGNGRVAVLFTPVVNRLSPPGSEGFVGGFFYGLDLLEGEGGNDGEVFYALVPDPHGIHSEPRSRERVLEAVGAVLAHEFQHMVHFHQRVLLRGGSGAGALWLSEGLAQMAEELVARAFQGVGDGDLAGQFRVGNRTRARLYLEDPGAVSLVAASGHGTLPERGGGWLFILYLADRWGEEVLAHLTRTTRTGVGNVTAATGEAWPDLLADFWSALYLEGTGAGDRYALGYRSTDLASLVGGAGPAWPLPVLRGGGADFLHADTLWSSSARHYLLEPPAGQPLVLRMAGEAGGAAPVESELGLRVLRLLPDGLVGLGRR